MSEDFLARWSRLKQEARRKDDRREPDSAPSDAASTTSQPEPELSPEEIAALPRLDALTAETDITGFLRRGVPASLRNAALRKMWLLDPAIRDFAGHARDYDYDWNTPGGVPGSGALGPNDDVIAMVRRVLGGPREDQKTPTRLSSPCSTRGSSGDRPAESGPPMETAEPGPRIKSDGDKNGNAEQDDRTSS
jgi:hypothetical protein